MKIIIISALFLTTAYAAVLDCNFASDQCSVASITDVTSANEAITVNGQPSGYVNYKTFSLSFQSPMKLNYVPTALFKTFPNLQSFSMTNASLTNLVSNAFANGGMLMSISLIYNNFPAIPASFGGDCVNVTSLNFMLNNIKSVDVDAFKGMKFLNYLMLRDNKISCLPPGVFRHTTVLQNIDLANNEITKLDPLTFRGLPNINSIMLGSNKIASIPAFDLRLTGMTMGFSMMMENNPIMAIHPEFLLRLFAFRSGYSQSTYLNFMSSYGNITTCLPKNNQYASYISNYQWPMSNLSLSSCYDNWNPEIENKPVSCAPAVPATTPRTPNNNDGNGRGSGEDPRPWLRNKDFFAIITNAMKNFTTNVQFF